jgi:hypothetical protein
MRDLSGTLHLAGSGPTAPILLGAARMQNALQTHHKSSNLHMKI